ncbi:ComEC/Rec2 family competence protein [Fusobacterium sp. PH5-44]|uniref:ComEC/Rec2 family competence protein n=1 Tax=unclassified Fusobacterium TaxID=2648384 RepID=UPI003D2288B4
MELLYVVALECFFSTLVFNNVNKIVFILIMLFVELIIFFSWKRSLLIIVIPLLFSLRLITIFNNSEYYENDTIKIEIQLESGNGEIKKINGGIPYIKIFGKIDYTKDGYYLMNGLILKKNEKNGINFYNIENLGAKEIKESKIKKYFKKKADSFTKKSYIDFKNMYMAVILGESNRLDKEIKDKFSYTGTSHLLALSGLHVGIIFNVIMFLLRKLPIMGSKRNMLGIFVITLYFLGVKNSPSLTRAYIMIIMTICGKLFYENVDILKSLTLSLIISMFINPLSINEISLKFSYLAVFAIIGIFPLIKKYFYKGKSKILDFLILTLIIQIFLSPILVQNFGKLPFLSFGTNLIIMPIGSFYVTLAFIGLLLENIGLGFVIMPILKVVYYIFNKMIDICSKIPYLTLEFENDIPNWVFITFYLVIFVGIFCIKVKTEGSDKSGKMVKRVKI